MENGRQLYKDKTGHPATPPTPESKDAPVPKPGSIASGIKLYQTKNNK